MVSSLVKRVMADRGLSQRELAETLGVSIDRVKSLTSGRVKKLSPDETRALVEKLHVRGDFLATGVGPVFQTPQEQEFDRRVIAMREASAKASTFDLEPRYQEFVRDVLVGAAFGSAELLKSTIDQLLAEQNPPPKSKKRSKP
ncbi:helix-turn-helix domain-containing protein [Pseudoxanthomonas sp. 22568]|uniref:helix-turn-helix domain-containing protein n=1 Tax=Pseudoxanthomonas sp. 22568 TaxID=3453945 RepID=UPI003F82FCBF